MSLNLKDKELSAVGISVAAGCRPCTDYHLEKVSEAGATETEIRQAVADALCVKRSAADIMEAHALSQWNDTQPENSGCDASANRTTELIKMGAAFAVNCTENLDKHQAAGRALGITDNEIAEITSMAEFIKDKAASHVKKMTNVDIDLKTGKKTCC